MGRKVTGAQSGAEGTFFSVVLKWLINIIITELPVKPSVA